MATPPSRVLTELKTRIQERMDSGQLHYGQPVVWGTLLILIQKAEDSVTQSEYEDYMGEDL